MNPVLGSIKKKPLQVSLNLVNFHAMGQQVEAECVKLVNKAWRLSGAENFSCVFWVVSLGPWNEVGLFLKPERPSASCL